MQIVRYLLCCLMIFASGSAFADKASDMKEVSAILDGLNGKQADPRTRFKIIEKMAYYVPTGSERRFYLVSSVFGKDAASSVDTQGSNAQFCDKLSSYLNYRNRLDEKAPDGTFKLLSLFWRKN